MIKHSAQGDPFAGDGVAQPMLGPRPSWSGCSSLPSRLAATDLRPSRVRGGYDARAIDGADRAVGVLAVRWSHEYILTKVFAGLSDQRWCSTPTTGHSGCSRVPAGEASTTTSQPSSARSAATGASANRQHARRERTRSGSSARFFTPRLRFKTYDELNAWLLDQCVAYARRHPHPVFGQDCLAGVRGRASVPGRLSRAVRRLPRGPGRRPAWCASTATSTAWRRAVASARSMPTDRIVIRQDGEIVAEHAAVRPRPDRLPWHYVPVLARKPGALRNGAPFKDWALPGALGRVRVRLAGHDDGDRQMVEILTAVLADGLAAVEAPVPRRLAACAAPTSCSTSSIVGASRPRRRRSRREPASSL